MFEVESISQRFLPFLSSQQIGGLGDIDKAIVILPLASIEQHGPHLPVYTDSIIALEVLERGLKSLNEKIPVWVLPLLPYGKSNEHKDFPGTFSLTSETLMKVLKEIGENVSRNGFRKFVIVNAHGGNYELVDLVMRDIREETGLDVFGLHIFLRIGIANQGLSEDEKTYGIHAADVETSILLHVHPELVNMDLAPDAMPHYLKELETPPFLGPMNFAWLTKDISESGVIGNAQTADASRGEKYLKDAADELATILEKISTFRI